MYRTVVNELGELELGGAAQAAGYKPGQMVEIILTRSGSLIVAKSDHHDAIDVPFTTPLPAPKRGRPLAIQGRPE